MPEFRTKRRVAYTADEMFRLVADVERYPEFVPFCERLTVRGRRVDGDREILVADMAIGYRMVRETFTSKVIVNRKALKIRADYLDGPFRSMENSWTFKPLENGGSETAFAIAYEFKSRTLALLMGAVFDRVFRAFAGAFEKRAEQIYGKRSAPAYPACSEAECGDLAPRCIPDCAPLHPGYMIARTIASASCTLANRIARRPISPKRFSRWITDPPRRIAPKCTSPTGFVAVPPPGPATPVTDTAISARECFSAPSAIARATSALTAPCSSIRSAGTPINSVFASLE
jgi:coenzyme Q-binding protein COQ10